MSTERPDLPGLHGLSDFAAALDPQRITERVESQAQALRELQQQVRDLRGVASSDDGFITATYSNEAGFSRLDLDPKAMRMPSEDLAIEIVRVAGLARDDYNTKHAELVAQSGQSFAIDPAQASADMQEISQAAMRGLGDIEATFQQFRSRFGV